MMFLYISMVRSSYIVIVSGMGDDVPIWGAVVTLFDGIFHGPFFSVLARFVKGMSIHSPCKQQWVKWIRLWRVDSCTIMWSNASHVRQLHLNCYLCLCVVFHKWLFWVPILAAKGPYFIKKMGPFFWAWRSLKVFGTMPNRPFKAKVPISPILGSYTC